MTYLFLGAILLYVLYRLIKWSKRYDDHSEALDENHKLNVAVNAQKVMKQNEKLNKENNMYTLVNGQPFKNGKPIRISQLINEASNMQRELVQLRKLTKKFMREMDNDEEG